MANQKNREIVPWQPGRFLTEKHANRLYGYLLRKAIADIEAERREGSEYPPRGSMAWRACVAERAYQLSETWKGAGDVAELYIMRWIENQQLYLWHPRQWEGLEQMLADIADRVSDSGRSVYSRIASEVLPYLKQHNLATVEELAPAIMHGGRGKLYHALPYLQAAIKADNPGIVYSIIEDVKDESVRRSDMIAKLRGDDIIPPSPAELRLDGDGTWRLIITMTEEQKRLVLASLRDRITFEGERH